MQTLERKAYIEFLEKSKIRITNPFRQCEFDLDYVYRCDYGIDLIDLRPFTTTGIHPKFYAYICKNDDYYIEIYAQNQLIEYLIFEDKVRLTKVKIVDD